MQESKPSTHAQACMTTYDFNLNHDWISNQALADLLLKGWQIRGYYTDDGHSWVRLSPPY